MSRCPICELKPMNCDCSEEARQLYSLRQEMGENQDEQQAAKQAERRELFKQVALRTVADYGNNEGVVWCPIATKFIAEQILTAAETFSKKEQAEND